ncbi:hypothetical protein DFH07DRAFT_778727 [Mycena maculata]|uniref:Uncharacterized protein n=1 Tax=Mycena maculata TaxID=230809 RepID=A0AAD7N0X5_9AGAR|nr:hypothetical protein DFH07DRAFT_778727 [Mycena maculata]
MARSPSSVEDKMMGQKLNFFKKKLVQSGPVIADEGRRKVKWSEFNVPKRTMCSSGDYVHVVHAQGRQIWRRRRARKRCGSVEWCIAWCAVWGYLHRAWATTSAAAFMKAVAAAGTKAAPVVGAKTAVAGPLAWHRRRHRVGATVVVHEPCGGAAGQARNARRRTLVRVSGLRPGLPTCLICSCACTLSGYSEVGFSEVSSHGTHAQPPLTEGWCMGFGVGVGAGAGAYGMDSAPAVRAAADVLGCGARRGGVVHKVAVASVRGMQVATVRTVRVVAVSLGEKGEGQQGTKRKDVVEWDHDAARCPALPSEVAWSQFPERRPVVDWAHAGCSRWCGTEPVEARHPGGESVEAWERQGAIHAQERKEERRTYLARIEQLALNLAQGHFREIRRKDHHADDARGLGRPGTHDVEREGVLSATGVHQFKGIEQKLRDLHRIWPRAIFAKSSGKVTMRMASDDPGRITWGKGGFYRPLAMVYWTPRPPPRGGKLWQGVEH